MEETLLNETGSLEKRSSESSRVKFHDEELKVYIEKHPDVMLSDIAKNSVVWGSGAFDALKYVMISVKIEPFYI